MGIFDKLKEAAEKTVNALDSATDKVTNVYKSEGFNGLMRKADARLTEIGAKTEQYLDEIDRENKQVMEKVQEGMNDTGIAGKIAGGMAATVNTTKKVSQDAVNVAKKSFQSNEPSWLTQQKQVDRDIDEVNAMGQNLFNSLSEPIDFPDLPAKKNSSKEDKDMAAFKAVASEIDAPVKAPRKRKAVEPVEVVAVKKAPARKSVAKKAAEPVTIETEKTATKRNKP